MMICAVLDTFMVNGRTVSEGFVWASRRGDGWVVSFNGADVTLPAGALAEVRDNETEVEEGRQSARADQYQEAPR